MQSDVQNVQMEFKGLRNFLDSKEKSELQKLKQKWCDITDSLVEFYNKVEIQRHSVRDLILDMKDHLDFSTMEMLQVRLQEVPASESQETWKPVPSLNSFLGQFQRLGNRCMHGGKEKLCFLAYQVEYRS